MVVALERPATIDALVQRPAPINRIRTKTVQPNPALLPKQRISSEPSQPTKVAKRTASSSTPQATVPQPQPTIVVAPKAERKLLASNVRVPDLPPFGNIDHKWNRIYLPSLYLAFYTSSDLFKGYALASCLLTDTVQDMVNTVYPNVSYPVKAENEAFCLLSYNRIIERRGAIAQQALDNLSSHLKSFRIADDAQDFLLWARRLDGPLYFANPTPAFCKAVRGDAGYIAPSGRLRSPFVIALVRDALNFSANAVRSTSATSAYPVGLFALVMTSLERAATLLDADGNISQKIKKFSEENYGAKVKTYLSSMDSFTSEQWDEILEEYDVPNDIIESMGDLSIADDDRLNIFDFESPKKRH
ncbi:hypothetical protein BKA70DRAFT_1354385 [Coprinopsis sp. MPI-PUGE-AT-0042]|nr:hypothetical protein BKA70DRAFT_1354385 [Coprinopsis sp. MPI-PUGE-AT-0042]